MRSPRLVARPRRAAARVPPVRPHRPRGGRAMIARTSYADLPRTLVTELADAGLDPVAVYSMVVEAFEEDLPDGGRDVTSSAMPAMGDAQGDIAAREAGVVAGLGVAELVRSEEHTSELQSLRHLVCRLLLEK